MFPHKVATQTADLAGVPCVKIGARVFGENTPPQFWPDIDVYFRGDLSQAFHLVDRIAEAGGQYLKGAVLHRESLCLKSGREVSYFNKISGELVTDLYENVIARHVVPLEILRKVMEHARDAGLQLVLSVYDGEGIDFARDVGALALKVPSSNITHQALIEEVAITGLPIVLDTGRSRFFEIERAVEWVRQQGADQRLIIQHSPPGPPAAASLFHLRMMPHLGKVFSCPIGLSDHHQGLNMIPLAVALGACVIEKGLVFSDADVDIDVAHALPLSRLKEALDLLGESWNALGKELRPDEEVPPYPVDRMCIIAAKDIQAGQTIDRTMIDYAFPPLGIGVEHLDAVVGATALTLIEAGKPLTIGSFASDKTT
jgi:sialic acid synthase SpsE